MIDLIRALAGLTMIFLIPVGIVVIPSDPPAGIFMLIVSAFIYQIIDMEVKRDEQDFMSMTGSVDETDELSDSEELNNF